MGLARRIGNLFRRSRVDREISAEMEAHIALRTEDNIAVGMTPEEARHDALLRFGNPSSTREHVAAADMPLLVSSIWADLRYACRQLAKNPGFTLTAIVVLALGIGASTAIFAFVDAALVRPLPYRDPSRIVALDESTPVGPRYHLSYGDYLDWKRNNHVFSSLDVYDTEPLAIATPNGMERARVARVSDGFFRTLGVLPMLGRDFVQGEDRPDAAQSVILSYGAWQKRFGGNRNVAGTTVMLDGESYLIVGVLGPEFHFVPAGAAEFWITLHGACGVTTDRDCHRYYGVARLKNGVELQTARVDLQTIAQQIAQKYPKTNRDRGATVIPLSEVVLGEIQPILITLLIGAGLLMAIGLFNATGLLLTRTEGRKREMAVRSALGASRGRIVRQFAMEGALLALCSAASGTGLALLVIRMLRSSISTTLLDGMPYLRQAHFNAHLGLFAGGCALTILFLFSTVPAISFFTSDMRWALHESTRSVSGGTWRKLGGKLVVTEMAIAMVLLASAVLLGKSFYNLMHVDIGVSPENLAVMDVIMPAGQTDAENIQLEQRIVSRIKALPGVVSAGTSYSLPVSNADNFGHLRVVGRSYTGQGDEANNLAAGTGYFETVRARLLQGRFFTGNDNAGARAVVILNETLAKQMFPSEDPIGKQIISEYSAATPWEVVGVIHDIQEDALDSPPRGAAYSPYQQFAISDLFVTVRTTSADETILHSMSSAVHAIAPAAIVEDTDFLTARINDTPAALLHRSAAWLVGGFAVLALLLSVVGLYGVIAYSVSQRTREIGVRMALGAQRGSVYRLILREAGWLTVAGVGVGLIGAVFAATLMRKLLFGTQAWDAPTLAAVAALMAVSALLASYFPARRAASVNPVEALRAE